MDQALSMGFRFLFHPLRAKSRERWPYMRRGCLQLRVNVPRSPQTAGRGHRQTQLSRPKPRLPAALIFWVSSPPASEEFVVIDGPLPAGVQPLCDFNSSSSSSSAPAVQTGFIIVDGPQPADGLGSHGSAATAMSPDSAHTHRDAPSSVYTGMGCTGSSSDESAAGKPIKKKNLLSLCAVNTVFVPIWTEM